MIIIEAPINLGLIEPARGKEPGVAKLPDWLKTHGLYAKLNPAQIYKEAAPPYSMHYDEVAGVRNADAIRDYSMQLSETIAKKIHSGHFLLVIGGDCSVLIGCALALKKTGNYGLFFIDGHTDFVTPYSSLTKGAAGMDLSIVTGYGHEKLSDIEGLKPYISENQTLAFGNRDMGKQYVSYIEQSSIEYFNLDHIRETGIEKIVRGFLKNMEEQRADGFWIHLDVDVLDDAVMPCVDSRQPGGLTYRELSQTLKLLIHSGLAIGLDLTILDPDLDQESVYTNRFINEFSKILNP